MGPEFLPPDEVLDQGLIQTDGGIEQVIVNEIGGASASII